MRWMLHCTTACLHNAHDLKVCVCECVCVINDVIGNTHGGITNKALTPVTLISVSYKQTNRHFVRRKKVIFFI